MDVVNKPVDSTVSSMVSTPTMKDISDEDASTNNTNAVNNPVSSTPSTPIRIQGRGYDVKMKFTDMGIKGTEQISLPDGVILKTCSISHRVRY